MYSKKVINVFKNTKNLGKIKNADAIGETGNIKCGDMMRIYLKIKNNIIKDVKIETYGCIAAIASSDTLCNIVKGKTINEAEKLNYKSIINELGDMPKIKYHCSMMSIDALKKAIKEYKEKNKNKTIIKEKKTIKKINENTTLKDILKNKKNIKILFDNNVPCLSCSHAKYEMDKLLLKDVCKMYDLNLKKILRELNS